MSVFQHAVRNAVRVQDACSKSTQAAVREHGLRTVSLGSRPGGSNAKVTPEAVLGQVLRNAFFPSVMSDCCLRIVTAQALLVRTGERPRARGADYRLGRGPAQRRGLAGRGQGPEALGRVPRG